MRTPCVAPNCSTPSKSRGLCRKHLVRWLNGKADYAALAPKYPERIIYHGQLCKIDGCKNAAATNMVCGAHQQRVFRYNDPHFVMPNEDFRAACREASSPKIAAAKPTSYAKYFGRHEHRVVAEKMLGRPLIRGEIVHHIDGDRRNNEPSNLEVMTQSEHARIHMLERWGKR